MGQDPDDLRYGGKRRIQPDGGSNGSAKLVPGGREGFPEVDQISGESAIKYQVKRYSCYGCPVACGGVFKVDSGLYLVSEVHKPEYVTIAAFGTLCLNGNVESMSMRSGPTTSRCWKPPACASWSTAWAFSWISLSPR